MKTISAAAIAIALTSCIPAKPAAVQPKPQPVEHREPSLTLARNRAIRACAQTGEAVDAERKFIGLGPTSQLYRENVVAFYRSRVVIEWPDVTAAQLCEELPEVLKVAYVVNCAECAKTIRSAVDAAACED